MIFNILKVASVASLTSFAAVGSALAVDLEFYFPVAVGGAAADTIEKLTADYVAANPDVNIEAIYSGSYADTGVKALTAARGESLLKYSRCFQLKCLLNRLRDVIIPFDDFGIDKNHG